MSSNNPNCLNVPNIEDTRFDLSSLEENDQSCRFMDVDRFLQSESYCDDVLAQYDVDVSDALSGVEDRFPKFKHPPYKTESDESLLEESFTNEVGLTVPSFRYRKADPDKIGKLFEDSLADRLYQTLDEERELKKKLKNLKKFDTQFPPPQTQPNGSGRRSTGTVIASPHSTIRQTSLPVEYDASDCDFQEDHRTSVEKFQAKGYQQTGTNLCGQGRHVCEKIPPCKPHCGLLKKTIDSTGGDSTSQQFNLPNALESRHGEKSSSQNQTGHQSSKLHTARTNLSEHNQKICARNPPCKPHCNTDCELKKDEEINEFARKYWHVISGEYENVIEGVPLDPKSTERLKEIRAFVVQNVNIIRPIYDSLVLYIERVNRKADLNNREPIPDDVIKGLGILRQQYVNRFCARSSRKLSSTEPDAEQRDEGRQANRNNHEKIPDDLAKQWNVTKQKYLKKQQKSDEGRAPKNIQSRNRLQNEPPPPPDPCCAIDEQKRRRKRHVAETPKLSPRPWMPTDKPKKKKEFSLTDEQKALVLDNYYPGLIHDAVNQKADFNEIAQKFVTPETAVDGDKGEKGMSLLEAFDTRVKYEQIMLKGLSSSSPDKANAAQLAYQPVYGPSPHPIVSDIVLEESVRASAIPVDLQNYLRTIPESDPVRAIACLSRAQLLNDYYKEYKAAQAAANLASPDKIEEAALFGAKTFKIDSLTSETNTVNSEFYKSLELVSYVGVTKPE